MFYNMMMQLHKDGYLKEEIWQKYCQGILYQLMEENKERLKEA